MKNKLAFKKRSAVTNIHPRINWYEAKDVVLMTADEGRDNPENIRVAQFKVLETEMEYNTDAMKEGEGPSPWTVQLLSPEDIRFWTKDSELPAGEVVIAIAGGGDSFGLGYEWILNTATDEILNSEDERVPA